MNKHSIIAIAAIIFIFFAIGCPSILLAGEQMTDFRNRAFSKEDLDKALFPEPKIITRSIVPIAPVAKKPERISVIFSVNFAKGSDAILSEHYPALNKLGEVLQEPPDSQIYVEGHTCNLGSDDYNQNLSLRRARNVKYFLIENFAISPERLIVKGFGENRPRADNNTMNGREGNRRVEFVREPTTP